MIIVVEMSARPSNRLQSSTDTGRREQPLTKYYVEPRYTAEPVVGFRQCRVKIIQHALILTLRLTLIVYITISCTPYVILLQCIRNTYNIKTQRTMCNSIYDFNFFLHLYNTSD